MESLRDDPVLQSAAMYGGILAERYGVSSVDELMDILGLGVDSPHLHALRAQVISEERARTPETPVIIDGELFQPLATWNAWSPDPSPSPFVEASSPSTTVEHGPSVWRRSADFARKVAAAPLSAARASLNAVAPPSPTTFNPAEGRAYFRTTWSWGGPNASDPLVYHIPMVDSRTRMYDRTSRRYEFAESPEQMAFDVVTDVYELDGVLDDVEDREIIIKEAFGSLYSDMSYRTDVSPIAPEDLPMLLTRLTRELSIRVLGDREVFPSGAERVAANLLFQKVVEAGLADRLENFDDADTAAWKANRQERPRRLKHLARAILRKQVEEPIGHLPEREWYPEDIWREHAHEDGGVAVEVRARRTSPFRRHANTRGPRNSVAPPTRNN